MEKLSLKTIFEALANVNAGNADMGETAFELAPLVGIRTKREHGDCVFTYDGKPVRYLNDLIDRLRDVLREDEVARLLAMKYDCFFIEYDPVSKVFFAIDESNPNLILSLHLRMRKESLKC